jgi:hypothetical protein
MVRATGNELGDGVFATSPIEEKTKFLYYGRIVPSDVVESEHYHSDKTVRVCYFYNLSNDERQCLGIKSDDDDPLDSLCIDGSLPPQPLIEQNQVIYDVLSPIFSKLKRVPLLDKFKKNLYLFRKVDVWPCPYMQIVNHFEKFSLSARGIVKEEIGVQNIELKKDGTYVVISRLSKEEQLLVDYGPEAMDICHPNGPPHLPPTSQRHSSIKSKLNKK